MSHSVQWKPYYKLRILVRYFESENYALLPQEFNSYYKKKPLWETQEINELVGYGHLTGFGGDKRCLAAGLCCGAAFLQVAERGENNVKQVSLTGNVYTEQRF